MQEPELEDGDDNSTCQILSIIYYSGLGTDNFCTAAGLQMYFTLFALMSLLHLFSAILFASHHLVIISNVFK